MITSNVSGLRLLPFYRASLAYMEDRYMDNLFAWVFKEAPAFEFIVTATIAPVVKLVSYDTKVETDITGFARTDLQEKGVTYKINSIPASTVPEGRYYYKTTISGQTRYSPIFTVGSCPNNISIKYKHSCTSFLTGSDTFTNEVVLPPNAIIVPEGTAGTKNVQTLDDGSTLVTSNHTRTRWAIEMFVSREVIERIQHINAFDTITIDAFGQVYAVRKNTFEIESFAPTEREGVVLCSFELDEEDEVIYCDCPTLTSEGQQPNGGQQTTDVACPNLSVSIDSSNLPTLTAVVSGEPLTSTPALTKEYKWYKDGVYFSSQNAIQISTETATWQLRVKVEGCFEKTALYTFTNVCNLFEVIPSVVGSTINANYNNTPSGETVTIRVLDDQGQSLATSLPFTASQSGTYTVEATAGECVRTAAVQVDVTTGAGCSHGASINVNDSVLEGVLSNVSGSPTIAHRWDSIKPDNSLVQVANTQNFEPVETGMYIYRATIGGCTSSSEPRFFVVGANVSKAPVITSDWIYKYYSVANGNVVAANNWIDAPAPLSSFTGLSDDKIGERIRVEYNTDIMHPDSNLTTFVNFRLNIGLNRIEFKDPLGPDAIINVWVKV